MKRLTCLLLLLSFYWLSGCNTPQSDLSTIKIKYSKKEINYFYETAFHTDDGKSNPVSKWERDILLFVEGDTLPGDRAAVLDAIAQLNNLHLPVKIGITNRKELANTIVNFGSRKKFHLEKTAHGIGEATISENAIEFAKIIIVTEPEESVPGNSRKSTILEEITQGLGLMGDSYAYPLSIFYEMPNQVTQLARIDKRVLQLLYDPAIPIGLKKEEFEEIFADQLYHINAEEKLLKYVKEQSVSKHSLQEILEYGVTSTIDGIPKIVKFHQPVYVIMKGDTTSEHKELVQAAIKELNEASDGVSVILDSADTSFHYGGVFFTFSKKSQQEYSLGVAMSFSANKKLLFDRLYRANIHISYKDTVDLKQKMSLAIANSMYRSVALVHQDSLGFFNYERGKLELKPKYQEVLKLYYSPSLAENMTMEELERVVEQLE